MVSCHRAVMSLFFWCDDFMSNFFLAVFVCVCVCESTSKHGVTLHNVFERQIANLDVKNMLHPFRRPPIQFLFVFPRSFKLSRGPERVGGGLRPTKTPPPHPVKTYLQEFPFFRTWQEAKPRTSFRERICT